MPSAKPPVVYPPTPRTDNPMVRKILSKPIKLRATEGKGKEEKPKKKKHPPIWAIDFDGTLCLGDRYPNIGKPNEKLIELLKMARASGVRLILWTARSGPPLADALTWCEQQGLVFDAVNDNLPEMVEIFGYNSRKVGADLFIDDRAFHFWGEEGEKNLCALLNKL